MTSEQLEKRKNIMRRSMALGHCVCDPAKPCPCPLFRERDVCECAGERLPAPAGGAVRLTETVRGAGCASKIGRKELREALAGLPELSDPRVLVGSAAGDDAGVIMLGNSGATILTVDVFAPSVDDPYAFGQVAAANSVSDIYAMGGKPEAALSIVGFPIHTLPPAALREILRGGADKLAEAGVPVVGGHSINDGEVKCGYAVIGSAPAGGFVENRGARPGDAIVLTKPLGTGLIAFAKQIGRADDADATEIAASMTALNRRAGESLKEYGAHAATDVTGFSLLGHMGEIVLNSNVAAELDFDAVPLFARVKELARREVLPGAVERNREAVNPALLDLSALAPAQTDALFGPETSGGLAVFLPEEKAQRYVAMLRENGAPHAAVIGRVTGERQGGLLSGRTLRAAEWGRLKPEPAGTRPAPISAAPAPCCCGGETTKREPEPQSCCGGDSREIGATFKTDPAKDRPAAQPGNAAQAFAQYAAAVNAPGALDAKTKKLLSLALSVATRCEPCVKLNAQAARQAGASEAEIAEAAALGAFFGGAPAAMFYNAMTK